MVKIAFDVGGVLFDDGSFELSPAAVLTVILAVEKYGKSNIYIISKAGPENQRKILDRLVAGDFYTRTNFQAFNVHFVREYEEKKVLCDGLDIDYMIDDHVKVIRLVSSCRKCIPIWFGPSSIDRYESLMYELHEQEALSSSNSARQKIIICRKWRGLRKLIEKIPQPY